MESTKKTRTPGIYIGNVNSKVLNKKPFNPWVGNRSLQLQYSKDIRLCDPIPPRQNPTKMPKYVKHAQ
jgi:hypothetical protein